MHNLKTLSNRFLLALISICLLANDVFASIQIAPPEKKHVAVVYGEIISEEVKQSGKHYYTEYTLQISEWLYNKVNIKESNVVTLRIIGGNIPEKGYIIKASFSPKHIPINEKSLFYLEETSRKLDGIFTVTEGGIIYGKNLEKLMKVENK